ncbi:polyprenyl synthetase family protein [Lentilactobacillus kefiri]|uniref:Farnesyl diphosphate synthase n=1 Tax=Lentilactobacillus kefiri TaxID=33962 RepID=A0A511DUW7_LENKE|nr:farnesyl diphosphate synthase [Lentilactobacillus kefiri]KRL64746.1 farnesyltranstransferase [Lentilactobacillus parakefiri DSM 10551]PAK59309.1 geranyl transferase [Lentilactobacillus kefiri]QGV25630.1 polyprenyl synthetase family protein [Lentilactobacillus kefiri]UOD77287.1 polyprenyl synthetase family protein [Lentilactobacillus kefiri]GEL28626.1 farnesyl-diphosphate synthase [Lentilactobacillus kefiri]
MGTKLTEFENLWVPKINQVLENEIAPDTDQKTLTNAMSYSVNAGGKRLRPLLTLAVLTSLGDNIDHTILKTSCALELMHSYSLIHDDLPAMDNDNLRRGKPTNHVKFGAGMATLAGDGLQPLSFQWLVDNDLDSETQAELVLALAKAAGPHGMVSGQADDIEFEGTRLPLEGLQKLDQNKTGALIRYAVEASLIMGRVIPEKRQAMLTFAEKFGEAYQIYDDILDIVGTEAQIGKPVHQDAGKNTYPNLLGLDKSYEMLHKTVKAAQDALSQAGRDLSIDTSLLNDFTSYFKNKDEK